MRGRCTTEVPESLAWRGGSSLLSRAPTHPGPHPVPLQTHPAWRAPIHAGVPGVEECAFRRKGARFRGQQHRGEMLIPGNAIVRLVEDAPVAGNQALPLVRPSRPVRVWAPFGRFEITRVNMRTGGGPDRRTEGKPGSFVCHAATPGQTSLLLCIVHVMRMIRLTDFVYRAILLVSIAPSLDYWDSLDW
jgi:hypothetical protein